MVAATVRLTTAEAGFFPFSSSSSLLTFDLTSDPKSYHSARTHRPKSNVDLSEHAINI